MQDKAAANMPAFRASLDAIAAHCAQAGATLVLAENPHHGRDIDTLFAPWWDIYRAQVEALAQHHGIRYINLNDTLPLPASAFTDVTHTNAAGRAIWSGRFLDEAVRWRQEGH
jgi:lysophospholipase L1-like esterase